MAEQLTMNRVIHAAVRRDLSRLDNALEAVRDNDRARAAQLHRAYGVLHSQLKHHHQQEDTHIFPALMRLGVDETLLAEMDGEHEEMSDALDESAGAMASYGASGTVGDAALARESLARTTQVVERHLTHEEAELEPMLAPLVQSAEFKQAEKELRKGSVRDAGIFFAWLTDGMEPEVRSSLRAHVPTPVVTVLSRAFGRSYHRDVAPTWRS